MKLRRPALVFLAFSLVILTACEGMEGMEGAGLGDMLEGVTDQLDAQGGLITQPTMPTLGGETTPTEPSLFDLPDLGASILTPEGSGPFPVVVLVHGGAWIDGTPAAVSTLAAHLVSEGFLVISPRYKLSKTTPGFPQALHDIACAVRMATAHEQGDGTVALIGHSAGAHLGAVIALTGNKYGTGCPYPGVAAPDKFIGLAGPYNVDRIGIGMLPFFGTLASGNPEAWAAGNPQGLTGQAQKSGLKVLLIHGDRDYLVEVRSSQDFANALTGSGINVRYDLLPGVDHSGVRVPEVMGGLLVDWLGG